MAAHVDTPVGARAGPKHWFLRHYLEMVVVMMVSMAALGGLVSLIFAALGHRNLYHYAGFRAFIMSINMTVGMIAWMRFRGHSWASSAEMAAAMILPFVLLIGPYRAGLISAGVFLGVMHVLMLPLMALSMIRRREEYATGHHAHQPSREPVHA